MLPGNKLSVFTRQGDITFKCNGAAIFRQAREIRYQHVIGRRQNDQIVATVILINTDDIKQVHGKGDQTGVVILLFNTFGKLLSFFAAIGVNFQQAIAALLQLGFQRVMLLTAGFDQVIKAIGVFRLSQEADQIVVYRVIDSTSGWASVFERIQTFVVPAHQHGLRCFFQERHVDLNIMRLTDTVQTTNTLFQQVRVERQVEHHQVAGELEVTPLGADFRTQHHLGTAIFFAKPGCRAVTFNDRHSFMEHGGADPFTLAQDLLQLQRGGRFRADNQHFLRAVAGQVAHQPFHARIKVPPGAGVTFEFLINLFRVEHVASPVFRTLTRAHNAGDFNRGLILGWQRQLDGMQFAFREAFHTVTGITEQHAAGAMAVHQH